MEKKEQNINIFSRIIVKEVKDEKIRRVRQQIKAIFGTTAKKRLILRGEPSYTSGSHMCQGAAPSLKRKATRIKTRPIIMLLSGLSKKSNRKSDRKVIKFVVPVDP